MRERAENTMHFRMWRCATNSFILGLRHLDKGNQLNFGGDI